MGNTVFSSYLLLNRITDPKIINRGSGIRMSWVAFAKILVKGGVFIQDSRVLLYKFLRQLMFVKQMSFISWIVSMSCHKQNCNRDIMSAPTYWLI